MKKRFAERYDENAGCLSIANDIPARKLAADTLALMKMKANLVEDIAYFREQSMIKHDETENEFENRVVEKLREEYVKRAAGAETLYPIKRLLIFNTLYPRRKVHDATK